MEQTRTAVRFVTLRRAPFYFTALRTDRENISSLIHRVDCLFRKTNSLETVCLPFFPLPLFLPPPPSSSFDRVTKSGNTWFLRAALKLDSALEDVPFRSRRFIHFVPRCSSVPVIDVSIRFPFLLFFLFGRRGARTAVAGRRDAPRYCASSATHTYAAPLLVRGTRATFYFVSMKLKVHFLPALVEHYGLFCLPRPSPWPSTRVRRFLPVGKLTSTGRKVKLRLPRAVSLRVLHAFNVYTDLVLPRTL